MFKIAIIGSGYIAKQHAEVISKFKDAKLVAIINPNPRNAKKIADQFACNYYSDLAGAFAAEKMDVVDICVPTYLHEEYVVEAADLGCHVLCEKPVALSIDSYDRMVKACADGNVRFMVAQVARWWPEFVTIKEYLQNNQLGNLRMIYEKRLCQLPDWSNWHSDPEKSGGGLYDLNIHDIDFLMSVFGKPDTVYAVGWQTEREAWMHVATSLAWNTGLKAVVETSLQMEGDWPFSVEFRATGSEGTLHYEFTAGVNILDAEPTSRFTMYPKDSDAMEPSVPAIDMFESEIREFLDSIKEEREASVTIAQVREVLQVIEATQKSLETGEVIKL